MTAQHMREQQMRTLCTQLSDASKELYGSHSYASGWFESTVNMMFSLLTRREQEQFLAHMSGGVDRMDDRLARQDPYGDRSKETA